MFDLNEKKKGVIFRLVRKIAKATFNFVMSGCVPVRPSAWNNLAPTGRIFMKFDVLLLFENLSGKFRFD
jgi:hypothetical protein